MGLKKKKKVSTMRHFRVRFGTRNSAVHRGRTPVQNTLNRTYNIPYAFFFGNFEISLQAPGTAAIEGTSRVDHGFASEWKKQCFTEVSVEKECCASSPKCKTEGV
ncbi:uncharacterized protein TM35_000391280 [Trypanosoma theileri]|uniref:Uncharacterized protein n=1 Tax=Trypanosoma theileri TaxID=67003 RepID=A0A1X0NJK0_9TRYP|nr:uncharacterized protein TM35_000391280 [Trypanosoma theileri]ORC84954.1 hypothetical protein TM35_000391280 [Trypanosoma theileri]